MTGSLPVFTCAQDLLRIENVSRESLAALEAYVELLLKWQKRINLIGPRTVRDVWHRHIADSLQLLPLLPSSTNTILDLGSGAGLPGIPLALACPAAHETRVNLIESNAKKAAFLREAVRLTGAAAAVHMTRIESFDSAALQVGVDVVTSRALAPLSTLLEHARKPLENGAIALFHKGQCAERELTEAGKYWSIDADRIASLTEPRACILKINEATRVA